MTMPAVDLVPVPPPTAAIPARGYWGRCGGNCHDDPVTIACATILLLILLSAIFADHLAPAEPYKTSMLNRLKPIGYPGYLLGSDELGRDLLSRLLFGGRLSLLMGVTPVVVALLIGGLLGVVAGFLGGAVNTSSCAPSTCSTPSPRCCWRSPSLARSALASPTRSCR
jgi:peptide/nickel transport system permease protein